MTFYRTLLLGSSFFPIREYLYSIWDRISLIQNERKGRMIFLENKLNFHVTGKSKGMQTIAKSDQHTITIDEPPVMGGEDTGPDPLTTFLCALSGCENVVANVVAKELKFDLQGIEFDIRGVVDRRGFMGDPNVKPYFEKVTIDTKVQTSETEERIAELQRITDSRCPLYTTLKAAGVELKSKWSKA